jgi:hypothetical protein
MQSLSEATTNSNVEVHPPTARGNYACIDADFFHVK